MTRLQLTEQIKRQAYGGQPTDDAEISDNLVNQLLNAGIALAAKENLKDNIKLEGVYYVNNSFFTTFKALTVTKDEKFLYKVQLPSIPLGIGTSEGVSSLQLKNTDGVLSFPCIPLSEAQRGFQHSLRPIPNKTIYYTQGGDLFVISTILLNTYTASVTMISGGDATNLSSTINIPDDYVNIATDYVLKQLMILKQQPVDVNNDGVSN